MLPTPGHRADVHVGPTASTSAPTRTARDGATATSVAAPLGAAA